MTGAIDREAQLEGREGLRVIRASNASPMTLDGTRSYIIGRGVVLVVDPGPDEAEHLDRIAREVQGAEVTGILLTHAHPDHAAGAPRLATRLGAPLMMGRGALSMGEPLAIDRWLGDGDRLVTDAGDVRAVATPGHVPEHLCFFWSGASAPAGGALLVGDLLMGDGSTTLIAPPEGDVGEYFRSLDRIAALRARVLYPAHGPPIEDPAAAIQRFRKHREQRLEQLRELLRADPRATADMLVQRIHGPGLEPRLRSAAEGSVRAMLDFLRSQRV